MIDMLALRAREPRYLLVPRAAQPRNQARRTTAVLNVFARAPVHGCVIGRRSLTG